MQHRQPLVSIAINNYNYAQYLAEAIDSALEQTYPHIEVVVVDDGSTDSSRQVIERYGDRIVPVFQENGGQASAFNAGFQRTTGELVIFLDADDRLLPHTVRMVVEVFLATPNVTKIQYRLATINEEGKRTGLVLPEHGQKMRNGDLTRHILAFPDDIAWQPTSGNAFAAHVLREILPMPEAEYRICADFYTSNLPPLFGPVCSLSSIGGEYRIHGANHHHATCYELEKARALIVRSLETHTHIRQKALALGHTDVQVGAASITLLSHRLVSLRLAPSDHPLPQDRLLRLLGQGIRAAWGRFDRSPLHRMGYVCWFLLLAIAPRPLVWRLAARLR